MVNNESTFVVAVKTRSNTIDRKQLAGRVTDDGWHVADEAIDISTSGRFVDNVFVVVVAQTATQLLVVHLGLVLAHTPASRHLVGVAKTELPIAARPRDVVLARRVQQQLQQKLPQLDWTAACKHTNQYLTEGFQCSYTT